MNRKKKNGVITVIIIAVVLVVVLGVVSVLSSGFQNMDARDWVNGYANNLKISAKAESSDTTFIDGSPSSESVFEWTMDGKVTIVSPEDLENEQDRSMMLLYNNDDEPFKGDEEFSISSTIALTDNDTAYGEVGYVFSHLGAVFGTQEFFSLAVKLDYDSDEECMRVIFGVEDFGSLTVHQAAVWHDLSWFGIYDITKVNFDVTYKYTDDGVSFDVKVGNKVINPYESLRKNDSVSEDLYDDWFIAYEDLVADGGSEVFDYSEVNVSACVTGTQAKFIDVQAK